MPDETALAEPIDDDIRVIEAIEPEVSQAMDSIASIAIGRAPTKPADYGAIRIDFCDGEGIAQFADLISRLARLGKSVELSIRVIDDRAAGSRPNGKRRA